MTTRRAFILCTLAAFAVLASAVQQAEAKQTGILSALPLQLRSIWALFNLDSPLTVTNHVCLRFQRAVGRSEITDRLLEVVPHIHLQQVADFYTGFIRDNPTSAEAHILLGLVWLQMADSSAAQIACDQAICLAPALDLGYYTRAHVRCYSGDYARAIADFTSAARLSSSPHDYACACRGQVLVKCRSGNTKDAIADMSQLIAQMQIRLGKDLWLEPYLSERALLYVLDSDYKAALRDLNWVIGSYISTGMTPNGEHMYLARGYCRAMTGDREGGQSDYRQALGLFADMFSAIPDDPHGYIYRSEALIGLGRVPDAVASLRKAAGLCLKQDMAGIHEDIVDRLSLLGG